VRYTSAIACGLLILLLLPAIAPAAESDEQALRQLLIDFEAARRADDKEAMKRLYASDAKYFQRSGREAFGNAAVVDLLFSRALGASSGSTREPAPRRSSSRILIDGLEAGGTLGFIYGRVCITGADEHVVCGTRWLLVTRKEGDGRWRILADIDTARTDGG
jgi:ketosteroid isomerase-like protein